MVIQWNEARYGDTVFGAAALRYAPQGRLAERVDEGVVEALLEISDRHRGESVVVVSHGDVIRSALLFALGMPLDSYNSIEISQGGVSTLRTRQMMIDLQSL